MSIEYRSFTGTESVDATDEGLIFGLAIPYNRETVIGDLKRSGFREQVAPGACSKSLREADIVALFNHDSSRPLGRTSAGNLTLKNTTRGVEPELNPVDTSYGRDLKELVRSKTIKGWSFGFEVIKDEWTDDEGRESNEYTGTNRVIREMKLIEVSPVTFPAYESTIISARDARSAELEAEGRTEEHEEDRAGDAPGNGKKPYGNVKYADPGYRNGKKRYPIDTKKHVKAAWAYISKKKNAAFYNSEQLAHIKNSIRKAAKKFGIDISEKNGAQLAIVWREEIRARKAVKRAIKKYEDRDLGSNGKATHGTIKRIPQITAELNEAMRLFAEAEPRSLPDEVQCAIALISSAATHIRHIQKHENLAFSDSVSKNDASGRADESDSAEMREDPKPEESTSEELPNDNALRLARGRMISRDVELDL